MTRRLMMTAIVLSATLAGCDDDPTGPDDQDTFTFSFEEDLDDWTAEGFDLGTPPVDWSITQSEDTSTAGDGSAKLVLDNLTDAGKIYLQRAFDLEPDTDYDVRIAFDFATADWGTVNNWTIIAGAHTEEPADGEDLVEQGSTANGEDEDGDHVWLEKSYDVEVTTDAEGNAVVAIGVWGTFEVERTYYIDDVRITFTKQ